MIAIPKIIALGNDPIKNETMLDETIWSNDFSYPKIQVLAHYFQAYSIGNEGVIFE
jgi:hypothetical protein